MNKYIIAIDQGTQSTKIALFDLTGQQLLQETTPLRPLEVKDDGQTVEHPDDDLWDSLVSTSQRFMENYQQLELTGNIIGIGLGSIRFNRLLLKADGTLAQPAISWMDSRVQRVYEHTNPEVSYVVAGTGYLTHRLTGEKNDTVGNYHGTFPLDTNTWTWFADKDIFELYNLPKEMLFNLKMPGDILGYVTKEAAAITHLPVGLPVIATSNDKAVEALGAGLRGDSLLASLGTYTATMIEGEKNYPEPKTFFPNFADQPRQYIYESGGIFRGMWTISWFKNLLGEPFADYARKLNMSVEELLNQEAELVPIGSEGLVTLLDWMGPLDKPYRKGTILGLDGRHGRAHMFRSILEGMVFTLRNYANAMLAELEITPSQLIISGGGSNSDLFMQIFADVFNIKTLRNEINGSASLGAAINVAVSLGEYTTYDDAIEKMVRIKDEFLPIPENVKLYQKYLEAYNTVTPYTDQYYQNLPTLGGE